MKNCCCYKSRIYWILVMKCVRSYQLLLLALVTGYSIVSGLSTCPTDKVIEERTEAAEAVQASVRSVFSNALNDSTIANDSLSDMEVYEHIAATIGVTATTSGFVQFQEAISEITAAKIDACSTIDESKITADYISQLTERFIVLTDAGNISLAQEVYGELLCLQDLLSPSDKGRKRRQEDPDELLKELEAFFDSLDGTRLALIFMPDPWGEFPATLAFVVDNTGSMGGEISSVQRLIRSFITTERTSPLAYILTTFNDPEVGVPKKYASNNLNELAELEQAVNALRATGGGDCPELGMTGILNVLSLANPISNVIVLTDASPKDVNRTEEVISEAIKKENSIHFFLSRDGCGDFTPYLDVANETYGIVVNHIDDFEAFVEFADKAGRFTLEPSDDGSGKRKRQTSEYCVDVTASMFTRSIDILISFISYTSAITITNPVGSTDRIEERGTIATYSVEVPLAGDYKICSTTPFEYSLSTTSDLDFFVEYHVNSSRTSLPTPGTPVNVLISSSKINEISTEGMYLNLLLRDGVVSSNALMHCGSLLSGVIVVPNEPFHYQLKGFDSEGNGFEETREIILTPETELCELPTPTPATITTTATVTTTPTVSPTSVFVECPCLNGGRCVEITRFGRARIVCSCTEGYSGSQCQTKLP